MANLRKIIADVESLIRRELAEQTEKATKAIKALRDIYTDSTPTEGVTQKAEKPVNVARKNSYAAALKTITSRGYAACLRGARRDSNPYNGRGGYRAAWFSGYDTAKGAAKVASSRNK